jgi:hypothetical protein
LKAVFLSLVHFQEQELFDCFAYTYSTLFDAHTYFLVGSSTFGNNLPSSSITPSHHYFIIMPPKTDPKANSKTDASKIIVTHSDPVAIPETKQPSKPKPNPLPVSHHPFLPDS